MKTDLQVAKEYLEASKLAEDARRRLGQATSQVVAAEQREERAAAQLKCVVSADVPKQAIISGENVVVVQRDRQTGRVSIDVFPLETK